MLKVCQSKVSLLVNVQQLPVFIKRTVNPRIYLVDLPSLVTRGTTFVTKSLSEKKSSLKGMILLPGGECVWGGLGEGVVEANSFFKRISPLKEKMF